MATMIGKMKNEMTIIFQLSIQQKARALRKMPVEKERVMMLQKNPRSFSAKNSVMRVNIQLQEISRPAPQRKTPMTATVEEFIRHNSNPRTDVIKLNIIVHLLPSHQVKNIAEKIPTTEPRMMELLRRRMNYQLSHLDLNYVARLVFPLGKGVYAALASQGRLQTNYLQLVISLGQLKDCSQKRQGLTRKQAEDSIPIMKMKNIIKY